jgi:glycosyltransferase involved in cell wall biosynthesis
MISGRYLLLSHIPLYRLPGDSYATDPSWAHDLLRHFDYIPDLVVCAPVSNRPAMTGNWVEIEALRGGARLRPLKPRGGWFTVLRNLFSDWADIRLAARDADIVHAGAAGWPFPLAFYLLPFRSRRRFIWIMVMESSFWLPSESDGFLKRSANRMIEAFVRRCIEAADIRIVTNRWYRDEFATGDKPTLVAPAVWVTEDDLRTSFGPEDEALFTSDQLRVVMATRLVPEKGVATFLAALERIDADRNWTMPPIRATLLGEGPLRPAALEAAARMRKNVQLAVPGTVPYGPEFFAVLREHHLMVVTNRTAEQPRNIYDAFSQGRGVLSTRTSGTADAIDLSGGGETFAVDDAAALAALLRKYSAQPSSTRAAGLRALAFAATRTHRGMHAERKAFLMAHLEASLRAKDNEGQKDTIL